MMGSGSTDSPAPSPTTAKIDIDTVIGIAAPINIDTTAKIDIDTAIGIAALTNVGTTTKIDIDTSVGIAVPAVIDVNPAEPEVDTVDSTVIDSVSLNTVNLTSAANVIGPISGTTGTALGGYEMAFGLFNFHVDSNGAMELLSIGDSAPLMAKTTTPPAIGGKPLTSALLAPSEEEPNLKTSTPSVGLNDFEVPPPSPTTAYCDDFDAYHYVGTGDFSSHEIAGCEDPRGGTAAVYPTISECERALNALTFRTAPYDPDYIEGLYLDYTCFDNDDDVYPEAKGKIGNSASSCSSGESAASTDDYATNYDSDFMIEVRPYVKDDDIYPPALGKISDDSTPWTGGYCMMASHDDRNENRGNDGRNRTNSSRQVVTHDQIQLARRVYAGEANFGPNLSPSDMAALQFVVQEQKDQISADRRILERRRDKADASSRRWAERSSHYSSSIQHRSRSRTQPGADMHSVTRNLEVEFNEAELMPKTKEAAIMAAAAYIAANTSNGDEHMRHLRNLALEGVRVLQGTPGSGQNATAPPAEQARHPVAVPVVAPRAQAVEPINGELRHGLAQNRVDQGRARREVRHFEEERDTFGGGNDELCGAECFSLLIRSTPLPRGIKLSDGIVKFNGQQDPRIWLDDFVTAVKISGRSKDNALQLLSLHLKDNARAWLNNLAPDSIRSWEEFWQAFIANFRGTSRRPTSFEELRLCVQKTGETLRSYISR
jgi:hypothetical protein